MGRTSNTIVTVNDRMQTGYSYAIVARPGRDFAPDFAPQVTPAEMLRLGVFGGKYVRDCRDEFPADWFKSARPAAGEHAEKDRNYFGVSASQPLSEWRRKSWIHPDDPRGWFQWYCRYYQGRRMDDDGRQIKRWKAFRRHLRQVEANCEPGDPFCRPRQRQALLHWAYDSRR